MPPCPRIRRAPPLARTPKASLEPEFYPNVDAALKDLKMCTRRLQPVLATFSDELQILHRLYYKGKNQHRPALFWRRVAEMRRYGDRVEELSLLSLVDSLRYSFFGQDLQQTSKLLKGSWTHYPDSAYVSFIMERVSASRTLVKKMRERLAQAYQSFTLAMQTGAFIQLILTLAGIASRLSALVVELAEVLELIWGAGHRIRSTLHPSDSEPRSLTPRSTTLPLLDRSNAVVQAEGLDEDTGVSINRAPLMRDQSRPAHGVGISIPPPPPPEVGPPYSYSPPDRAQDVALSDSTVIAQKMKPAKEPRDVGDPDRRRKVTRKRVRDEIDAIFG
ncbi:hypothetical protein B0H15DRAFT_823628 [Mycena belliarum]|uniref:Nucleolus and neural progenitor protein-like N-terminal domain-containing protein n=1 Tax=Mycena belliarum TaxID=1033014 RepID=A0AAD6UIC0_9AGAR|nr:hypothetical protein B0H15DRAFT_823628 [Mycena belliae]